MLLELVIENYAVIDRLQVRFHAGLNLLTGETGSGKSIVVDALALLLGGRSSSDMIRSGETRARVAGIFEIGPEPQARELLQAAGFSDEEGELLIEREVQAGGKSRAFVGSRPAAVSLLRELAPHLGDIHGQHDQQLLFSAHAQREMLDSFAETGAVLRRVGDTFRCWRAASAEIERLERAGQETLRMADVWNFQRKEISAADPRPGEDTALDTERKVLQNLGRVQESAGAAYAALYDSPDSALSLLRLAAKRVNELCRIDAGLSPISEHLRAAELTVEEAAYNLRDYLSGLEANPARLEEIESRLAVLDRLKRKYGSTIQDVLRFLEEVEAQLQGVENTDERLELLRKERDRLAQEYETLASELSELRKDAAGTLEKRVEDELGWLAMQGTSFRIGVEQAPWSESGFDAVRYLVSPNRGEELRPLEKVASGGEISRIALALKTCLAAPQTLALRTLVFDEVDAGIGGRAAEGVGRRLKQLAASHQVLCVTHLAQIAGFADHHYQVEKKELRGRAVTLVKELDSDRRTREVARMLSGQKLTPEALKHAERLIRMSAG